MSDEPRPTPSDPLDSYMPGISDVPGTVKMDEALATEIANDLARQYKADGWESPNAVENFKQILVDGFVNTLTGMGDPNRDKTLNGSTLGPQFVVNLISGPEAESLWRGSDLGARIVEQIPAEMTRKGWTISVQPEDGEFPDDEAETAKADSAGLWRKALRILANLGVRRDEWPTPPVAPTHTPAALPKKSNDGTSIVEALAKQQRSLKLAKKVRTALRYRRAYGGGAVLMNIDDGQDLVRPVDESKIKAITGLTAYRGGWDGELIAWSYYNELGHPKYGQPRVYMLRNLGVPIASPPAPGQPADNPAVLAGPGTQFADPSQWGNLVTYVHESRLLIFGSQPEAVSNRIQVQMRGWTDSIFTRVLEVLSQFNQTWSGVSILLSELSIPVQSVEGLSALMAAKDKAGISAITARAIAQKMAMSIARMRLIDTKEKLERMEASLTGIGEVLAQYWLRLAAASGMPVSMLMGQVQGGLGDASKGDVLFFYDQIAGMQDDELLPAIERVTRLQMLAKEGPTKGQEARNWAVAMNPLREMSEQEEAELRKTVLEGDKLAVDMGSITPEEQAATRFSGPKFNSSGNIVLDIEARALSKANEEAMAAQGPQTASGAPTPLGGQPAPTGAPQGAVGPQKGTPAVQAAAAAEPKPPNPMGDPPPTPLVDAADFITRNGRTKVRTQVSAIAAFNEAGQLLMGRRRESGKWCAPAGHAEPGETPLGTAIRELHEETGLHPKRIEQIGVKNVATGAGVVRIALFRAIVEGEPSAANDPDNEFDTFKWVDPAAERKQPDVFAQLHHARDVVVEHVAG